MGWASQVNWMDYQWQLKTRNEPQTHLSQACLLSSLIDSVPKGASTSYTLPVCECWALKGHPKILPTWAEKGGEGRCSSFGLLGLR